MSHREDDRVYTAGGLIAAGSATYTRNTNVQAFTFGDPMPVLVAAD